MKVGLAALYLLLIVAACDGAPTPEAPDLAGWRPDPRPLAKTMVYLCEDGYEFVVRLGPGEMALWAEGDYRVLSQVRSASGVKYREGELVFWMKGEEALLERGSVRHGNCLQDPSRAAWADARRRGVVFRAVGQEPGWHLEMHRDGRLHYVGAYGATRIDLEEAQAAEQGGVRVFSGTAGEHFLRGEIHEQHCVDSMSGDGFPSQVILEVDGQQLGGCGTDLEPLH